MNKKHSEFRQKSVIWNSRIWISSILHQKNTWWKWWWNTCVCNLIFQINKTLYFRRDLNCFLSKLSFNIFLTLPHDRHPTLRPTRTQTPIIPLERRGITLSERNQRRRETHRNKRSLAVRLEIKIKTRSLLLHGRGATPPTERQTYGDRQHGRNGESHRRSHELPDPARPVSESVSTNSQALSTRRLCYSCVENRRLWWSVHWCHSFRAEKEFLHDPDCYPWFCEFISEYHEGAQFVLHDLGGQERLD